MYRMPAAFQARRWPCGSSAASFRWSSRWVQAASLQAGRPQQGALSSCCALLGRRVIRSQDLGYEPHGPTHVFDRDPWPILSDGHLARGLKCNPIPTRHQYPDVVPTPLTSNVGASTWTPACSTTVFRKSITFRAQPRAARDRCFDLALRGARLVGCSAGLAAHAMPSRLVAPTTVPGRYRFLGASRMNFSGWSKLATEMSSSMASQ